jgi:hypothetical protein
MYRKNEKILKKSNLPLNINPRVKKPKGNFEFWEGLGRQANSNAANASVKWAGFASVASMVLMLGTIVGLNSSVAATQAVLHADDRILAAAMDMDADALAYVLNRVDVGE